MGTSVPGTSVPGVPRRPRPNQRCLLHLWCRFIHSHKVTNYRENRFSFQGFVLRGGFHLPLLSLILRFLANNLMRLNILLASQWKDFIVRRAENGPIFPSSLNLLEPFIFIPILVSFTFVRALWESLVVLRLPVVYLTGSILGVMLYLFVQKSGYMAWQDRNKIYIYVSDRNVLRESPNIQCIYCKIYY